MPKNHARSQTIRKTPIHSTHDETPFTASNPQDLQNCSGNVLPGTVPSGALVICFAKHLLALDCQYRSRGQEDGSSSRPSVSKTRLRSVDRFISVLLRDLWAGPEKTARP
jgi:hypothetical protein